MSKTGKVYHHLSTLLEEIKAWKESGESVVFTNGCFDILHVGHVTYLKDAKSLGDRLVLGLNSDESVRKLKGEKRPIVPQEDRAKILEALESIDAIIIFDERDVPLGLIESVSPDFLCKGGDYHKDDVIGAKEVEAKGGSFHSIPFVAGKSTTDIVQKILQLNK